MSAQVSSGYSGTPLAKKLGVKEAAQVLLIGAPENYLQLLEPLPMGVQFAKCASAVIDIVQVFVSRRETLADHLAALRAQLRPDAAIWVSWPKRASKVATDITEDTIRELAFPLGLVDIKVCAVDATWSGLKLVVRKELR